MTRSATPQPPALRTVPVLELKIEDEHSFRHVGLYADLKNVLVNSGYQFRILPDSHSGRWDRALLLNLTYWGSDAGTDLLVDEYPPADAIAHAAWHHLAAQALANTSGAAPCAEALFLGEAIASAFDVYLVGRLLGHSPESTFLETQVVAMAESSNAAGLSSDDFDELLQSIAEDPDRAFADLRELLTDASAALFACQSADEALVALASLDGHRFAPLLHHYELSNWVLYARAYGRPSQSGAKAVADVDRLLRAEPVALDWLTSRWVLPRLADD